MGWCESPAFFCSASETARDIAQTLRDNNTPLQEHPLENLCMPKPGTLPTIRDQDTTNLIQLLEVYVDDFIGLIQAPTHQQLQHFTRAILHAIHRIFPPAAITKNPNDEPIALKKLAQGDGLWASQKEILGWLFDGLARTISLPTEKNNIPNTRTTIPHPPAKITSPRPPTNPRSSHPCITGHTQWERSTVTHRGIGNQTPQQPQGKHNN